MTVSRQTLIAGLFITTLSGAASAHEAWVQPGPGPVYPVEYGDFTPEAYPVAKVKELKAFDASGKALKISFVGAPYGGYAKVAGKPSVITLFFDNGQWTKNADGVSINLPKSQVPGGTTTSHPLKYGKTILKWDATAFKPQGQRIEIVPIGNAAPKPKSPMSVQVLFEGKPLADTEVELVGVTPEGKSTHTDADGKISIDIDQGIQRLAVQHKLADPGEAGVESKSVTAALLFVAE